MLYGEQAPVFHFCGRIFFLKDHWKKSHMTQVCVRSISEWTFCMARGKLHDHFGAFWCSPVEWLGQTRSSQRDLKVFWFSDSAYFPWPIRGDSVLSPREQPPLPTHILHTAMTIGAICSRRLVCKTGRAVGWPCRAHFSVVTLRKPRDVPKCAPGYCYTSFLDCDSLRNVLYIITLCACMCAHTHTQTTHTQSIWCTFIIYHVLSVRDIIALHKTDKILILMEFLNTERE